jgi:hypothetical protein
MINIHRSYYETGHENTMRYYCSSVSWPSRAKRYIDENPDANERNRLSYMVNTGKQCLWFYGDCYWRDWMK